METVAGRLQKAHVVMAPRLDESPEVWLFRVRHTLNVANGEFGIGALNVFGSSRRLVQ
jgi:hypothetical protein